MKLCANRNPSNDLVIDEFSHDLLKKQDMTLESIPTAGQKVYLKDVANMSQGAVAVDVTSAQHVNYQKVIDRIVRHFNTGYFAVDFLASDPGLDPLQEAYVLEINARPEWMHHTFSEVRQHDMAKIILDAL